MWNLIREELAIIFNLNKQARELAALQQKAEKLLKEVKQDHLIFTLPLEAEIAAIELRRGHFDEEIRVMIEEYQSTSSDVEKAGILQEAISTTGRVQKSLEVRRKALDEIIAVVEHSWIYEEKAQEVFLAATQKIQNLRLRLYACAGGREHCHGGPPFGQLKDELQRQAVEVYSFLHEMNAWYYQKAFSPTERAKIEQRLADVYHNGNNPAALRKVEEQLEKLEKAKEDEKRAHPQQGVSRLSAAPVVFFAPAPPAPAAAPAPLQEWKAVPVPVPVPAIFAVPPVEAKEAKSAEDMIMDRVIAAVEAYLTYQRGRSCWVKLFSANGNTGEWEAEKLLTTMLTNPGTSLLAKQQAVLAAIRKKRYTTCTRESLASYLLDALKPNQNIRGSFNASDLETHIAQVSEDAFKPACRPPGGPSWQVS